ncbi:MAG TPA: B12-binding domain-containing radical SAM protein [Candidatus Omnitrophica bacterium]|nr:B12-binding domain-containing radical SAM protein [Candidatus Omnitrophota bacterium]
MKKKRLFRIIIPAFPKFNIYSSLLNKTTALGPICIATAVKKLPGWETEVIDENNFWRKEALNPSGTINHQLLQQENPADVVGFYGGMSSSIPRLYQLAKFYKKMGAFTITGGHHFVSETIPEAFDNKIDVIAIGEGEDTIKELLIAIQENKSLNDIWGIAFKENGKIKYTPPRPSINDLDSLPIPDFGLLKYARLILLPLGRVRGCGMNCEFCAVKGAPRFASPERLVEEIAKNYEKFNIREFFIVDDLFAQDREDTLKLCKLLSRYQARKNIKFKISVQIRLDKAKDEELLSAMKDAGIRTVIIGFESPIAEELKAMRKGLKPEDIVRLTKRYQDYGFAIHGMFIFGYPAKEGVNYSKTPQERVEAFKKFIDTTCLDTIQVLLPVPLPGTELRKRLLAQNRIYPSQYIGWEYYDGTFPLFEPDPPFTPQNLQNAVLEIMSWFYNRKGYFKLNLHLFLIPSYILRYGPRKGLREWKKKLRMIIYKVIGYRIIQRWLIQQEKLRYFEKLDLARKYLVKEKHPVLNF